MLKIRLVEHFPVVDLVMVAGLVEGAELVGEAALRVPGHQAGEVFAQFLQRRVAQLVALLVVPGRLVGIIRILGRLLGLEHPGRDGAEVQRDRMPAGGFEEIDGERVDQGEIPTGFAVRGGLQLGDGVARIREPGYEAHIVRAEAAQFGEGPVVDRRAAPQERVDHYLEGGSGIYFARYRLPVDVERLVG